MNEKSKLIVIFTITATAALLLMFVTGVTLFAEVDESTPKTPPDAPAPSEKTPSEKTEETPLTIPEPITPVTYSVLPIFKMGDELQVEEEQKWDGKLIIQGTDKVKSYPYFKEILQQYNEKIILITPDQLNFKSERQYRNSVTKSNMPDEGKKSLTTSLEGKTLVLESKNYQIVSYEKIAPKEATIISDDYSYINSFNWFYSCLPEADATLSTGATYQIKSKELAKIIFKKHYDEKLCIISGDGVLEEITESADSKKTVSSRILIKLKIKQSKGNTNFNIELTGLCRIVANNTPSIELEISGPFSVDMPTVAQDGTKISSSSSGILRIKSKVAIKK